MMAVTIGSAACTVGLGLPLTREVCVAAPTGPRAPESDLCCPPVARHAARGGHGKGSVASAGAGESETVLTLT